MPTWESTESLWDSESAYPHPDEITHKNRFPIDLQECAHTLTVAHEHTQA